MAAGSDRLHHRLHNFNLHSLKWGNQKLLRSIKIHPCIYSSDSNGAPHQLEFGITNHISKGGDLQKSSRYRSPSTELPIENFKKLPPLSIKADDDIDKVREKLLIHLRTVIGSRDVEAKEDQLASDFSNNCARNLSTQATARDSPIKSVVNGEKPSSDELPPRGLEVRPRSLRLRGLAPEPIEQRKTEIPRVSVSLSRQEIEEDFLAMTGSRPSRRPRKRAKIIQKKLDETFPGLWLSNITPDLYKVNDATESRKS